MTRKRTKRGKDVVALLLPVVTATTTTTRMSTTGVRDTAEQGVVAKAHRTLRRLAAPHQRKTAAVPQQLTMTTLMPGLSGRPWHLPQSLQVLLVEKPHQQKPRKPTLINQTTKMTKKKSVQSHSNNSVPANVSTSVHTAEPSSGAKAAPWPLSSKKTRRRVSRVVVRLG